MQLNDMVEVNQVFLKCTRAHTGKKETTNGLSFQFQFFQDQCIFFVTHTFAITDKSTYSQTTEHEAVWLATGLPRACFLQNVKVCMLNICYSFLHATCSPGPADRPVWITDVSCLDSFRSLRSCQFSALTSNSCDHSQDITVQCSKYYVQFMATDTNVYNIMQDRNSTLCFSFQSSTLPFAKYILHW